MKYDVLEGGIRVPGLIRWPAGLPQGEQFDEMLHFTDWMPTLLQVCGIDAQPASDGMDVMAALRGEGGKIASKRFWQFNRYDPIGTCNAAMRDGGWKLYWPRIEEAMVKLKTDGPPFQKNFEVPHFMMDVSNPPVERELSPPGEPELYHIDDDPHENTNLALQHPERVDRMKQELETWFEAVEADRRQIAASRD
jgi:arylsulfatase A